MTDGRRSGWVKNAGEEKGSAVLRGSTWLRLRAPNGISVKLFSFFNFNLSSFLYSSLSLRFLRGEKYPLSRISSIVLQRLAAVNLFPGEGR